MRWLWRIAKVLIALVIVGLLGTAIGMRMTTDTAADWHVDPATSERTGRPNDYLVAPAGVTKADPDRAAMVHALPAEDLLFLFDAVARPSSTVLAGSVKDKHITYVQRTAVMGFPDYVTVKAVDVDGGASLIIWSRSRYGYSDMGVNQDRIDAWLAQIEKPDG